MVVLFAEHSYGNQITERAKCVAGTRTACFILDRKCENSITLGRTRYGWRSSGLCDNCIECLDLIEGWEFLEYTDNHQPVSKCSAALSK